MLAVLGLNAPVEARAAEPATETPAQAPSPLTLTIRDTSVEEVFEMLSRQSRVNILLGQGVTGAVSVNLFKVDLDTAVRAIAQAAGFVVDNQGGTYYVLKREDFGLDAVSGNTEVRSLKVQYSDPAVVGELLQKHLSRFGKITPLPKRRILVVEDLPPFLERVTAVLREVDAPPKQILIEAQILEITLDSNQTYGVDWRIPFRLRDGDGSGQIGQSGLTPAGIAGFFFEYVTPDLEVFLNALRAKGRVRTLSTPKLLVLENEEAEVIIGDRTGFKVTTTINQVTTESIQFIESGVILKIGASIDRDNRVLLDVHPEVSTATVNNGIPSLTTTEVTTRMRARDGQGIFIGGLIRTNDVQSRSGIPVLSDLPLIGAAFSRTEERAITTETIVLITPHLVDDTVGFPATIERIEKEEPALAARRAYIEQHLPPAQLVAEPDPAPAAGRWDRAR